MAAVRTMLKTGAKYGIIVYLIRSTIAYFYSHPISGGATNYGEELLITEIALAVICFSSGEYSASRSGKIYIGALTGCLTGVIGTAISIILLNSISFSWIYFLMAKWVDFNGIIISLVIGIIFGFLGALLGVKYANTSHKV